MFSSFKGKHRFPKVWFDDFWLTWVTKMKILEIISSEFVIKRIYFNRELNQKVSLCWYNPWRLTVQSKTYTATLIGNFMEVKSESLLLEASLSSSSLEELMPGLSCLLSDLMERSLGVNAFQLIKKLVDRVVSVRYCLPTPLVSFAHLYSVSQWPLIHLITHQSVLLQIQNETEIT